MNEHEMYGAGMGISRTINGKRVNLSRIKKKDKDNMTKIVKMAKRHDLLLAKQDWKGLKRLAKEYEKCGAVMTAKRIRLEIPTPETLPKHTKSV